MLRVWGGYFEGVGRLSGGCGEIVWWVWVCGSM